MKEFISTKRFTSALALAVACGVGCSSSPVPPARVASAENAVQSARSSGADKVPDANTSLTMAEGNLAKARSLMSRGDNDKAAAYLTRAEADANVASALTREAAQKAATQQAIQRVNSISTPTLEPSSR